MSSATPSYANVLSMGPGAGAAGKPEIPTLSSAEVPTYERPEYDEGKVQSLTQQHAAPGVRTLREAYQTAAARLPSDPKSRLTLRDALKGYGTGLESVMGGARKTARAEYGQEYGYESEAASQVYAAQVAMAQQQASLEAAALAQQFSLDYADYMEDKPDTPQTGGFYTGGVTPTWVPPGTSGPMGVRPGM